jgi:tetratricopeptide (TPR) repeat protein
VYRLLAFITGAALLALAGSFSPCVAQADDDAVSLFQDGRFKEARSAFLHRLELSPDDPEALYYLGQLVAEAARSRQFLERLIRVHPGHRLARDAAFDLAEADYAHPAGRYLSARRRYRDFLSAYPDNALAATALYRIGLTYLVVHEPDSAIVAFDETIDRFPESEVAALARLGGIQAQIQRGETGAALRAARTLLADSPGPVEVAIRGLIADLEKQEPPVGEAEPEDGRKPGPGRFWVQVGAFRNVANLQALQSRLEEANYPVRVEERGDLKVLLTGPYSDQSEAEAAEKRIENDEGLSCRVVKKHPRQP